MAATDPQPFDSPLVGQEPVRPPGTLAAIAARALRCLSGQELQERVEEEVGRAGRHRTPLCLLLLRLDDFEQIAQEHGGELAQRALLAAGETLLGELRRFDRIGRPQQDELVVVLPGAAGIQGETVARRALQRLREIKIEVDGARRPLCVSIGIAAWRAPWNASQLIAEARCAAGLAPQSAED
ncbi:MAG: GGDEF domain-containing protein [Solirubrobacteraceae bacterium]